MAHRLRSEARTISTTNTDNKGRISLQERFELMESKRDATNLTNMFHKWYCLMYGKKYGKADIVMTMEILDLPPLTVAGCLSECAQFVDEIVDVANTLRLASQLVESQGWLQGSPGSYNEGYDLMGAVDAAVHGLAAQNPAGYASRSEQAWTASISELRSFLDTAALARWNDSPSRTKREVVATLQACGERVKIVDL